MWRIIIYIWIYLDSPNHILHPLDDSFFCLNSAHQISPSACKFYDFISTSLTYKFIYDTSDPNPQCQIQSTMKQWRSYRFLNSAVRKESICLHSKSCISKNVNCSYTIASDKYLNFIPVYHANNQTLVDEKMKMKRWEMNCMYKKSK